MEEYYYYTERIKGLPQFSLSLSPGRNTKNEEVLAAAFLEVKYAKKRNKSSYNFLGMDPQIFLSFAAVFDIIKKL